MGGVPAAHGGSALPLPPFSSQPARGFAVTGLPGVGEGGVGARPLRPLGPVGVGVGARPLRSCGGTRWRLRGQHPVSCGGGVAQQELPLTGSGVDRSLRLLKCVPEAILDFLGFCLREAFTLPLNACLPRRFAKAACVKQPPRGKLILQWKQCVKQESFYGNLTYTCFLIELGNWQSLLHNTGVVMVVNNICSTLTYKSERGFFFICV